MGHCCCGGGPERFDWELNSHHAHHVLVSSVGFHACGAAGVAVAAVMGICVFARSQQGQADDVSGTPYQCMPAQETMQDVVSDPHHKCMPAQETMEDLKE